MIGGVVVFLALVLVRIGAFVTFLPLFGGQAVPRLVKIGMVLSLSVFWVPEVAAQGLQRWMFAPPGWAIFVLIVGKEALLGAVLGYAFGLFLLPARIAGEYLTQELGLSFGNLVDPGSGVSGGAITLFLDMTSALLFLVLDIHHVLLAVFHATFTLYPLGGPAVQLSPENAVVAAQLVQHWGLSLIAPVGLTLFLTTIILALMARSSPQMNMFAVGFPLRILVGLLALLLLLPGIIAAMTAAFDQTEAMLRHLV